MRESVKMSIFSSPEIRHSAWIVLAAVLLYTQFQSSPSAAPGDAAEAPPEQGLWYDDTGDGAVEIAPCGGRLCGHVVWLKNPIGSNGQPLHDLYNPEPNMRHRPICGIQVLGNLALLEDGAWGDGWVYDPKVGKSYNVEIRLSRTDLLEVHGYAGLKLFGKKLYWKRAPADLPRCSEQALSPQKTSR